MRTYQVISGDGHIEGPIDFTPYLPEQYAAPGADGRAARRRRLDLAHGWRRRRLREPHRLQRLLGPPLRPVHRRERVHVLEPRRLAPPGASPDPVDAPARAGPGRRRRRGPLLPDGRRDDGRRRRAAIPTRTRAGVRAYTEFLAEYCAVAPDRLIGTMLLPYTGLDDIIAEMEHGRERGLRAVCLQNWPNGQRPDARGRPLLGRHARPRHGRRAAHLVRQRPGAAGRDPRHAAAGDGRLQPARQPPHDDADRPDDPRRRLRPVPRPQGVLRRVGGVLARRVARVHRRVLRAVGAVPRPRAVEDAERLRARPLPVLHDLRPHGGAAAALHRHRGLHVGLGLPAQRRHLARLASTSSATSSRACPTTSGARSSC